MNLVPGDFDIRYTLFIPGPPSQTIFSNFARVHTYIDWGYLLDIYSNQNSSTIFGIL